MNNGECYVDWEREDGEDGEDVSEGKSKSFCPARRKKKQNYFVTSFLITELKLTEVVLWLENIQ